MMEQQPAQQVQQQPAQQQQAAPQTEEKSSSGFNPAASNFNFSAQEFVPLGTMANTKEQFPDLDALGEAPTKKSKKNKKKNNGPAQQVQQKAEEDSSTPYKGKPSSFFVMKQNPGPPTDNLNPNNYELNGEQWSFMF